MPELVGVSQVGVTNKQEIMANTAGMEVVSVTLPGGSAVTYLKGVALIDGATIGTKAKYTNSPVVNNEAVGTGNGAATAFDLDFANVEASSLKGYVAGVQWDTSISVGTGAGGVDQIVFAVAPTNLAAITADYTRYSSAKKVSGACILLEDASTTVAGGNVVVNGLVGGSVLGDKIKDAAGVVVDSVFKAVLPKIRFA